MLAYREIAAQVPTLMDPIVLFAVLINLTPNMNKVNQPDFSLRLSKLSLLIFPSLSI